ncbi:MAG: hypothetical protein ACE5FI_12290, partial [Anaerolineales bacterium]
YTGVETVGATGGIYDLALNTATAGVGGDGRADAIGLGRHPTNSRLLDLGLNAVRYLVGEIAVIKSLTITGSADDDTLTIDDVNGLPTFAGAIPTAEDNANIIGEPHILFAGGAGNDALNYKLQQVATNLTYAVGTGLGGSNAGWGAVAGMAEGEILTEWGRLAQRLYFTGLEPITVTGALGVPLGQLAILGDRENNLVKVMDKDPLNQAAGYTRVEISTLSNDALLDPNRRDDDRRPRHFFETLDFAADAFTSLRVRGLAGNDSIELWGYDRFDRRLGSISLAGGSGNDRYVLHSGWRAVTVVEGEDAGRDTLDFTPASAQLIFTLGAPPPDFALPRRARESQGVFVSDAFGNTVVHLGNFIEHLIGGVGDDRFIFSGPGVLLAGGRGTIDGGAGRDVIDYRLYARYNTGIFNGLGLARPANVEIVLLPPAPPPPPPPPPHLRRPASVLDELFDRFGDRTLDELVGLVKRDAGTHHANGTPIELDDSAPTAIQTPEDNLVLLSSDSGAAASVRDVTNDDLEHLVPFYKGAGFINRDEQIETFSSDAEFVTGVTVDVSDGNGAMDSLSNGGTMAVVFEETTDPAMVGRDMVIMWWDAALGTWHELATTVTADGRYVAVTSLTGTFVLVAR